MIVLDCSVSASWFLADEVSDYATRVLESATRNRLVVPSLWLLEMTNTMLTAGRRGRVSSAAVREALEQISLLPFSLAPPPTPASLPALQEPAERNHLSAYDAEYLRVAREAAAPLATLDVGLRRAAEKEGISLFRA